MEVTKSERDRSIIQTLDALRRIVRALRESSRAAERKVGVSGAQLFVLKVLASAPQLSIGELAERTRTHQSSVSVVAKRLCAAGYATREPSPDDARRALLRITRRGRALLQRAPNAAQERLIQGLERMSLEEQRALAAALLQLTAAMQLDELTPEMFFEEAASEAVAPRRSAVAAGAARGSALSRRSQAARAPKGSARHAH